MTPRLAAIRDRIHLLAAIDPAHHVFGSAVHGYRLEPTLDADAVAEVEARTGALPEEYRRFVETVAGAGAGPYYGLMPPGTSPDDPSQLVQPDPNRVFRLDDESASDINLPPGAHLLDGTLVLAEQGSGGRSLLVVRGGRAGEVWSDWTRERGTLAPEATSVCAWYEQWLDRALVEWIEHAAPAIALDGPTASVELEAIALAFELVERGAPARAACARTLGYLHVREERWQDAVHAFELGARLERTEHPEAGDDELAARLALDLARLAVRRGDADDAIERTRASLGATGLWYATRDELRDTLERAYAAAGRSDDALAVLEERVAERHFSLDLHHRLARERLARNDLDRAGATLERAAMMASILGRPQPLEIRVPASFDPIIEELERAGRAVDAEALAARRSLILEAN